MLRIKNKKQSRSASESQCMTKADNVTLVLALYQIVFI